MCGQSDAPAGSAFASKVNAVREAVSPAEFNTSGTWATLQVENGTGYGAVDVQITIDKQFVGAQDLRELATEFNRMADVLDTQSW